MAAELLLSEKARSKKGDLFMLSAEHQQPMTRLANTFGALCDFLAEPRCRQCEVLATCLRHIQEDASEHASSRNLLPALRQVPAFTYVRRRFGCRRCEPAEILATYLTPGGEEVRLGTDTLPALSWMDGEQDLHW